VYFCRDERGSESWLAVRASRWLPGVWLVSLPVLMFNLSNSVMSGDRLSLGLAIMMVALFGLHEMYARVRAQLGFLRGHQLGWTDGAWFVLDDLAKAKAEHKSGEQWLREIRARLGEQDPQ
jgi:hypothetical protein